MNGSHKSIKHPVGDAHANPLPLRSRKRNRLDGYDYSLPGMYFVTICTKDRKNYFGQVSDSNVILNNMGEIAYRLFNEIPVHFDNIRIEEFIIMPNHLHAIIVVEPVGDAHANPLQNTRMKMTLSNVINSYKSSVSRTIRQQNPDDEFAWQRSFHDHIIRTPNALSKIQEYIIMNPINWSEDIENGIYDSKRNLKYYGELFTKIYE